VEKPDPRAYEILIDQLELPSESILLIDNRLDNVEEAIRMGLDAILFESPEQIYQELINRCLL
jgi:FMN phosphatase YigB (HAD superfamily)